MLLFDDRIYGKVAYTQFNPKTKHFLNPNRIDKN